MDWMGLCFDSLFFVSLFFTRFFRSRGLGSGMLDIFGFLSVRGRRLG